MAPMVCAPKHGRITHAFYRVYVHFHEEKCGMGLLGDFAKGFVIMAVVFWIFAIIEFICIKLIELALLLLIGLTIPLSLIAFEYLKNRKKGRT